MHKHTSNLSFGAMAAIAIFGVVLVGCQTYLEREPTGFSMVVLIVVLGAIASANVMITFAAFPIAKARRLP